MGCLVYDPIVPLVNESVFHSKADWEDFYGQVEEEMPPNMPEPHGNPVSISAFVNANHAGNIVTCRLLAYWNHHLRAERTHHLTQQETEYG